MKTPKPTELTKETVSGMAVGILWDSTLPGLCARRRSPGLAPRYAFKYRCPALAVCDHSHIPLDSIYI